MQSIDYNRVGIAKDIIIEKSAKSTYEDNKKLKVLIHEALINAGFGKKDLAVPLADIIRSGMTVLIKPNWVLHYNHSNSGMDCMITNPYFVLSVLDEVIKAKPARIIIGDAPIQSCEWNSILTDELRKTFYRKHADYCLDIIDFRRTVVKNRNFQSGVKTDIRDKDFYISFDLKSDSLLEPISKSKGRFRITNYPPSALLAKHQSGKHQYLLCKEPFEADVIISLPKLKTHRKTGMTGALKNLVGLNGNKEYLPHFRAGGSTKGGDSYNGFSPLKKAAQFFYDRANENIGKKTYDAWMSLVNHSLNLQKHFGDIGIEGSWYGNDTTWRMVLDINRILIYGRRDGTMANIPQRQVLSITDGIICGEGEGPLAPKPFPLGVVTCSKSASAADIVHSMLLRLDVEKIPLVRESINQFRWPLVSKTFIPDVIYKNESISLKQVALDLGFTAEMPSGWIGYCELDSIYR